ncbi:gamma-glutamyltransferase family protein [Funiculus sociatus GB2-A5]|uniref:Gamma-glutamyltransferase family protein n=1 Tax=Funiculus sociatus GB2-A5 TaxID=2933946 RepID=A0ABV0JZB0_9CYAN|nr:MULTISPECIES: gamma-glutamyltransferase family protein [unclassified Trichocoleus]MBD1908593.1 gamma-glutamyltransferase family protein [Trichocoleus sp. FACHB-832]MBD2063006.1 gamma-glutamyltransferase family protein [Trichocoleus sp. FACHB-6]
MPSFLPSKRIAFITIAVSVTVAWCHTAPAAFIEPLRSKQGMVVSAHPLGSEAGVSMLRKGGNAVDAAVATAFAISVVEPFSAGIGGGGFLLLRLEKTGEIKALDFRERAPLKATRDMYLDAAGKVRPNVSVDGHLSVAVPGTVAGLYEIHRQYGKLSWQEVVAPSVKLAQDGFIVSRRFVAAAERRKEPLLKNPAARQVFTRNGAMYQPGERLIQTDLAKTLQAIAQNPQSFYTGNIARAIADDMAKNGGLITLEDLRTYKTTWRTPVCGNFRQSRICSMPPPSSGGVHLLEILNIIGGIPSPNPRLIEGSGDVKARLVDGEANDLKSKGWHHPDTLHLMIEAMRIAYADRAEYLGDPDFVKVPVSSLINPAYAAERRQEISMNRARLSSEVKPADKETLQRLARESNDTTHLTVVDENRNTVSLTFTVNYGFGSGVVVPGTGILLNDEMDDFAAAPGVPNAYGLVGGEANAIAPRKIPLSSMTPTIVTENGKLRMAVGAPGGSTIITTVLQVVLNVLEYGMNAGQAVSAPRIHHQWLPDQVNVEPFGLDVATIAELRRRGHKIEERSPWGNANAIVVTPDGFLEGAADPRGEGAPSGY